MVTKFYSAFKPEIGFLGGEEKYQLFLKKHMLDLEPKYYAVVHNRKIDTPSGVMIVLHITTDIEHPGFEPIAEGWINGRFIYLWREHCWGVAVTSSEKQIINYDDHKLKFQSTHHDLHLSKTVLVFKIGSDKI